MVLSRQNRGQRVDASLTDSIAIRVTKPLTLGITGGNTVAVALGQLIESRQGELRIAERGLDLVAVVMQLGAHGRDVYDARAGRAGHQRQERQARILGAAVVDGDDFGGGDLPVSRVVCAGVVDEHIEPFLGRGDCAEERLYARRIGDVEFGRVKLA